MFGHCVQRALKPPLEGQEWLCILSRRCWYSVMEHFLMQVVQMEKEFVWFRSLII
jgi:hypothetical protein